MRRIDLFSKINLLFSLLYMYMSMRETAKKNLRTGAEGLVGATTGVVGLAGDNCAGGRDGGNQGLWRSGGCRW